MNIIFKDQLDKNIKVDNKLKKLFDSLKDVNSKLWIIEDEKDYMKKI